ncbi:unannotated protein [freshwater metagenome]|uniref:Unannotated protein n=1 Tax=freshwater metagenome TaxID=449393 RepID=A0A6J7TX15_9ZZZZ
MPSALVNAASFVPSVFSLTRYFALAEPNWVKAPPITIFPVDCRAIEYTSRFRPLPTLPANVESFVPSALSRAT